MHFLLFSLPSLQISDFGASRSLSNEYPELGSSYNVVRQLANDEPSSKHHAPR